MKNKYIATWCLLLLTISCATVEPPRVENKLYINPQYQFSVRVPDGWDNSEKLPGFLKKGMPFSAQQKFKTIFSDLDNKCVILVGAEKTKADWASFKMYSDRFISSLDKFLANEKKKRLKDPNCVYYRYEIYRNQIENCDDNCIATKIDFQITDLKAKGHNIIYKSNYGQLYTVTLIFIAREDQYTNGLKVFESVTNSFQHS